MAGLMIQNYCPQIFKDLHRLFVTQNGRLMMQYCCPQIFTDLLRFLCLSLKAYHTSQFSTLSSQLSVAHRFSQIYTDYL